MSVVQIGTVRMAVAEWHVPMQVRVRLRHRPAMSVLMMLIVNVSVLVLQPLVGMLVAVALGQVQP